MTKKTEPRKPKSSNRTIKASSKAACTPSPKHVRSSSSKLQTELEQLRARLVEAEDTLDAIRNGEIDALVVSRPLGDQVFTLKGAEHVYRVLVEEMNEGAATLNPDGTILYCNNALTALLGKPLEKVMGTCFRKYLAAAAIPVFDRFLKQSLKDNSKIEAFLMQSTGSTLPVLLSGRTLSPDEGVHWISMIVTDLTVQKQAENLLRRGHNELERKIQERTFELEKHKVELESQNEHLRIAQGDLEASRRKYADLYDFAPIGYFSLDHHGLIQEVNLAGAGIFAINKRELLNKSFSLFISDADDREVFLKHRKATFTTQNRQTCELRLRRNDGSLLHAQLQSIAVENSDGKAGYIRTAVMDITERKQAEEGIKRSNLLLDAVVNNTHLLMACLDVNFNFIWVNRAYANADGKDPAYFPGKNHFDLYPHEENQAIFRNTVKTGKSCFVQAKPFEYKEQPERGVSYWDWGLIPILDEKTGNVERLVLTLLDITDRKQAEESIRRNNILLDGIGRILIAALTSRSEEELGKFCLAVAEEVTQSKFGFISELGPDGLLHNIAISDPGWKLCTMNDKTGHRKLVGDFKLHGLYGRVFADGKPFFTNDPKTHPDSIGLPKGHPPLTAFLGVPLRYEGKTIGMIAVGNRDGGYRAGDMDLLHSFSVAIVQAFMRKRAEKELETSKQRIDHILESINDGFFALDREWRIIFINHRASRNGGFGPGDVINRNIWEVFPSLIGTEIEENYRKAMTRRVSLNFECKGQIKGTWYGVRVYPSFEGISVYWVDITERKRAEEEINRLNQDLQWRISEQETIFKTAPIGIAIAKDPHGLTIVGNPANERMLGLGPGGQLSKRGHQQAEFMVFEKGRALSIDELPMQRAVRGEVVSGQIVDVRRKDGKTVNLLCNAAPLYDEQGTPRGAVGAFLDISEVKRTEEALRASERRYRTLFESMTEVFQLLEIIRDEQGKAIDCRYREVNPAFEKLTGLKRDQVLNKCASEYFRVVDENWLEFVSQVAAGRQPVQREDYSPGFNRYFSIHAFSPGRDFCAMLISDITERKRAELALQRAHEELEARVEQRTNDLASTVSSLEAEITARKKAEEELSRLGTAVEAAADALVVIDAERGIIQYVNPAFERMTGYSCGEVVGRDLHILDSDRHDQEFYLELRETLQREGFWSGRLVHKKKDGTLYEEECTYSAVKNSSGEVINYISIKRDVTERSRLESIAHAVDSMNNIGYIFAGVSHELGNPIGAMRMTLDIMKRKLEELPRERLSRFVDDLTSQVQNVEYLLKTLKNFNMYESLEPKKVDLPVFLESFLSMVRNDFESRGITIDCSVAPKARSVYADPRALQQVLLNIFTNAADALEGRDRPKIRLRVAAKADTVTWKIEDNGRGIEEGKLQDLFKPFYTTKPRGTGLGLVIIKKMLSKMDGTVGISSRLNEGTVVELSLPSRPRGTA